LTEDQAGSSGALYAKKSVEKRLAAHRTRREQECIVMLARTYVDILTRLDGNVSETFRLFDKFTKTAAKAPMPVRRRGRADPALDARILAAGDAAPRGGKEMAVTVAAGAKTVREIDAARKRYNRLSAERDAKEKWLAELVAAVRRNLRLGPRRDLFESTFQDRPSEGDKYPP
jgi:hypothetical protein